MKLTVTELCKNYKDKKALKNINLSLEPGLYGLLGENGAGKSTLMRIITTVDKQSSGTIELDNQDIFSLGEKYRDMIGYLPQDFNVYPTFTAQEFLEYMGALKGISRSTLKTKIPEVLEFVNLSEAKDRRVANFSGGMKRRIGIAMAILNDPKILILDEPTAGLDPRERIRFANIISAMSENRIVILSTHIISDIEAIANQLIIIREGKILQVDNISNITSKMEGKVWESVVDIIGFQIISQQRQIIRRKQNGKLIKVRYAGEQVSEYESKEMEPVLEDYYMYEWK